MEDTPKSDGVLNFYLHELAKPGTPPIPVTQSAPPAAVRPGGLQDGAQLQRPRPRAGDFVQVLFVAGLHSTAQSSLSESPLAPLRGCEPALITTPVTPSPLNEPASDFLFQRIEPLLKAARCVYRYFANPRTGAL